MFAEFSRGFHSVNLFVIFNKKWFLKKIDCFVIMPEKVEYDFVDFIGSQCFVTKARSGTMGSSYVTFQLTFNSQAIGMDS